MKSFLKTASRAVAALFAVALITMGVASPAFADGTITNKNSGKTYTDLATATAEAKSGETILLGEGNYTLYKVNSEGHTKGKDLTFEGLGTDKTAWNIGALVPDPANYGTEYNGDYSFDGAGTVTFRNMTMRSGSADYLGFIRANKTVLDGCVVNGKTFYWGYESAEFKNTTFNAPNGDYAIWTYSSPTMTFNDCTFNCAGKAINVYTDYGAGKNDITVNVNNCTFKSTSPNKTALKINDSNMADKEHKIDYKYKINIAGSTTVTGLVTDPVTCSKVFGFGGEQYGEKSQNSGRTDVTIDGKLVWSGGKMLTHDYTDGQHEDNFVDQNNYVWKQKDDGWYCTGHAKCGYCSWPIEETVKATFVDKTDCTEKGERTYTATFAHKCFKPQTKTEALDPIGHDWGEPEYTWSKQDGEWLCTAKRTCKRDASHVEQETVKATVEHAIDATCETAGKDVYTATFENEAFKPQTWDVALGVLGHDWGAPEYSWTKQDGEWLCTAKRVCKRDASHVDEQTVKATVKTTPATCLEEGESVYTAKFDGDAFEAQTKAEKIAALGHDWAEPEYSWSQKDGSWYCTAKRTCKRDASHVEEETVKASVETTPATCTEEGESVYTAKFDGDAFEAQTKAEKIAALGHDWAEPEYSWSQKDGSWYCTAKRTCKRDASHVEEETVKAAYKVTTPATTEKEGEGTYTATFENEAFETQTKTESIDKLPVKPQKPAKPKDDKPSKSDKTNKQTLPGTGDSTANVIMAMLSMTAICFAGSAIASKMRK